MPPATQRPYNCREAMKLERHFPDPPLAAFVDYTWHLSDTPAHARERILPNGTQELVFNLSQDEVRIYDGASELPCRRALRRRGLGRLQPLLS